MKIEYFSDTDSLYIDLSQRPSAESFEASPGVVIDYDAEGNIVGIDIDKAAEKLDLHELTLKRLGRGSAQFVGVKHPTPPPP